MRTYTIKEVERILKRKEKTIRNYIKEKKLNASFFNNRYVITEKDIENFFNDTKCYDEDEE